MLRNHEIRSTHEQIGGSMRSHFFSYRRGTLVAPIILGLSLTLLTMVLNASYYAIALGNPAQSTSVTASIPPRMFAVFAAGDITNPIDNLFITGGGQGILIKDGGLYSGGDTHINNTVVTGGSSAITSVGTCGPTNQCLGTGAPIFNGAPPLPLPQFFDINDFLPGGAVEAAVGSRNYHYIDGDMTSFASVADGVYYVTGNVNISGGTGTHRVTIVSQGNQQYSSSVNLYAYFHNLLFFSNSTNESNGAIEFSTLNVTWQGLIFAPNGDMNMSASSNDQIYGAMYAQHVGISGSAIVIVCTLCSPIEKSVTPISSVRTNDVVTYTIIATNNNLITDTDHLILTDTLPVSVTFGQWIDQPPNGILQADNAITWTGILSAGESISLTFTATNTNSSGNIVTNIAYYNNTWETDSAAATFTVSPISYTLTISSSGNGNGIVTPTTGIYTYPFGTVVTSTASANIGSTFTGWSGECSSTGTCITAMTSDKSITATFALNIYTLTLATAGNGSGVITPTAGTYPFTYATVITLEAAPNFGSTFTGWSGDAGCAAGPVTMDADKACAATFITHHSYLPIIFK